MRKRTAALVAAGALAIAGLTAPAALAQERLPSAVVITFSTPGADEVWKARFTHPQSIKAAYDSVAGRLEFPVFPIGKIVWGETEVNTGYNWHITDARMTEVAVEACDGRPSYVVKGTWTYDSFCPWNAKIESIQPA